MTVLDFPTTGPKTEKISPSVMRALRAVERGEVFRVIGKSMNKMVGPMGVGPQQYWRCRWVDLIEDGARVGDIDLTPMRYQQVLTEAGKKALETGLFQG